MKKTILLLKGRWRTALLVLLLSVVGMGKGYAAIHDTNGSRPEVDSLPLQKEYVGVHDTIGNIEYYFAGPHPAAPYKYPYNAAIVMGHKDGTEALGPLVIPDSVHWLGNENSVLVPVVRIHAGAFAGCTGLTSLTIPNTVEEILYGAFGGCSGLMGELVIPNSVLSIGPACYYPEQNAYFEHWGAFAGCNFTSVTIKATTPPNLSDEWDYFDPFYDVPCSTLTVPCGCIPAYESSDWHNHFTTIIEDCTGLSEDSEDAITVFPNPTTGQIKIEAEGLKHISISNLLGQCIYESKANGNEISYDFGKHEAGIYLVRIETAEGVVTKRVVVTR